MFQATQRRLRKGFELRYLKQSQDVRGASVFKAVIGDVLLIFGIAVVAFFLVGYLIESVKSGEWTFPIKQGVKELHFPQFLGPTQGPTIIKVCTG